MKEELELTIHLTHSLDEIQELLKQAGFRLIEESVLDDIYMKKDGTYQTVQDLLNNCILIRKEGTHFQGFTLKKKEYKENGDIKKNQKLYLEVPNLETGKTFLEFIGYHELFHLKQKMYFYKKGNASLSVQIVENLGTFLEYEAEEGETEEQIKKILENIFHQTFSNYYEKKAIEYIKKYHLFALE